MKLFNSPTHPEEFVVCYWNTVKVFHSGSMEWISNLDH